MQLSQDMEQRGADNWEARGRCHNLVTRTCARGGMLDEGLELLDNMYKAELHIQRDTVRHHSQSPSTAFPPILSDCTAVKAAANFDSSSGSRCHLICTLVSQGRQRQ